ncbi:MAG: EamA family transporter [Acidobacteriota bacterium]
MFEYWMVMVFVTLVFWGITGVTQKLATNHISARTSSIWFGIAFVPVSVAILASVSLSWSYSLPLVLLAVGGGVLNGMGTLPVFMALERGGKASIVIPLVALYPLLTVLLAYVFLGERLTGRQWLGVSLAIGAGLLLSKESEISPPK